MSGERDDGGPAFPVADFDYQAFKPGNVEELKRLLSGMTLRDYFAAHAPLPSDDTVVQMIGDYDLNRDMDRHAYLAVRAAMAYEYADAMLKARQQ